jgi:hypothetical protein
MPTQFPFPLNAKFRLQKHCIKYISDSCQINVLANLTPLWSLPVNVYRKTDVTAALSRCQYKLFSIAFFIYRKIIWCYIWTQASDRSDFLGSHSKSRSFWKIGSDSAFRSTCIFWIADPIRSDLPIHLSFEGPKMFFLFSFVKRVWQKMHAV